MLSIIDNISKLNNLEANTKRENVQELLLEGYPKTYPWDFES